jgi:hypothetical protein
MDEHQLPAAALLRKRHHDQDLHRQGDSESTASVMHAQRERIKPRTYTEGGTT